MKSTILLLISLMLPACQFMQSDDPSRLDFRLPAGSTLSLNKTVEIPAGKTHVLIQSGQPTTQRERNQYNLACRLDFREFGQRSIEPEVFAIRRTEHREGWESRPTTYFFESEIFLDSEQGTDIIKMVCRTLVSWPGSNFSYADMQQTLGDYLTFNFNFPPPQSN